MSKARCHSHSRRRDHDVSAVMEPLSRLEDPENFHVGLPDTRFPPPHNILIFRRDRFRALPNDALHHRYLLIFSLKGDFTALLDGHLLRVRSGQALLVLPFQAHRFLSEDDPELRLCITFELPQTDYLEGMRNRPVEIARDLWQTVLTAIGEYQLAQRTGGSSDAVTPLVSFLLMRLLRDCRIAPPASVDMHQPLPSHRIVQRACRMMVTKLSKNFTVRQIALDLSISEGYLRTCFRRVLGIGVCTCLRRMKVYSACSYLSRSESHISKIADECGFGSVYAFSRAFKREIGMAPTAYRAHLWEGRNLAGPG